jgi:hypothetical protein
MDLSKIQKLRGASNYDVWSIRVEALLIEKGYNDIMNLPTLNQPSTDHSTEPLYQLAEKRMKACSMLRLTLEDGPLLQTRYITDPAVLWTTLRDLYAV